MVEMKPINFSNTATAFEAKTDGDLRRSYLLFKTINYPTLVKLGTSFINVALKLRLPIKNIIKATLFKQFCGGESIEDSQKTIEDLYRFKIGTILDYSVEGESNESDFDATYEETLRTITKARGNKAIPFCVFKPTGVASIELLTKVSEGKALTEEETAAFERVKQRFDGLCKAAHEAGQPIFVDAEDSWYQDAIDDLVYAMMVKYNQDQPIVYNTFQMYRKYMLDRLMKGHQFAQEHGVQFGAKLVRGAYMEKEAERAAELGYENPINPTKEATDQMYDDALRYCMEHNATVGLASCSHNEDSAHLLMELMNRYGIAKGNKRVFFAQLLGMSDHLSYNLARADYNVAKYVPYGPVEKVMPYLFRRAEENTSVAGQSSRELMLVNQELKRRRAQR
nr:proline dehydrogenase family protein [Persicobacter sp. CCB-QB2]